MSAVGRQSDLSEFCFGSIFDDCASLIKDSYQPMTAAHFDEQLAAKLPARTRAPMSALAQAGQ
ncbi:hypothetical protein RS694_10620 [Rhodoferax saidenbachensis]|uniref:Uncharacterized protein n=1 Tax=Rhodoferax saidenbachensis TaxID=1484693 RepID=A0A1P8KAB1_9BURK|nr:hypothetical protein RS694_10620 [Rhodoferax saidenbachensis]